MVLGEKFDVDIDVVFLVVMSGFLADSLFNYLSCNGRKFFISSYSD